MLQWLKRLHTMVLHLHVVAIISLKNKQTDPSLIKILLMIMLVSRIVLCDFGACAPFSHAVCFSVFESVDLLNKRKRCRWRIHINVQVYVHLFVVVHLTSTNTLKKRKQQTSSVADVDFAPRCLVALGCESPCRSPCRQCDVTCHH